MPVFIQAVGLLARSDGDARSEASARPTPPTGVAAAGTKAQRSGTPRRVAPSNAVPEMRT